MNEIKQENLEGKIDNVETKDEKELSFEDLKDIREELLGEDNNYKIYFNEEMAKFASRLKNKYGKAIEEYRAYNDFMGIAIRFNKKGEDKDKPIGPIVDVGKEDFTDPEDSILEFAKKLKKENLALSKKKEGEPIEAKYKAEWLMKYKDLKIRIEKIKNSNELNEEEINDFKIKLYNYAVKLTEVYGMDKANKYVLYHSLGISTLSKDKEHLDFDVPEHEENDGTKKGYSIEKFLEKILGVAGTHFFRHFCSVRRPFWRRADGIVWGSFLRLNEYVCGCNNIFADIWLRPAGRHSPAG